MEEIGKAICQNQDGKEAQPDAGLPTKTYCNSGQNDHLIAAQKTRERIASETGTSESYIVRWFLRVRILIAMEFKLIVLKNIFSFFLFFL